MSPFSFCHLLDQDVRDWAARQALDERERGRTVPASLFVEKLAGMLGITKRQIYRYLSGECTPPADTLVAICKIVEATHAVEWLCREVGLRYHRAAKREGAQGADLLTLIAEELKESAKAGQDALKSWEDHSISVNEYRELEKELDHAMDTMMDLKSALRAKVEAGLRR